MTRPAGTEVDDGNDAHVDAGESALRLSGDALRPLLELIPVGVLFYQSEQVLANRRAAELTGLSPTADLRGDASADDAAMPFSLVVDGRELSPEENPIRRALTHGTSSHDRPLRVLRGDGAKTDVHLSVWPITDPDGAPRGALVTLTEPGSAPTNEAMERIEYLASLGALAASIAHEINNPLNSIMVNAELALLALGKSGDQTKVRQVLETIIRDVKRCGAITHGVLQLSKARDTEADLHDLNEMIRRTRELVAAYFRMHDAILELELDELPPVRMNATIMEHAVVNLLRNAVEAGGKGVRVHVRTRHVGDTIRLTVSDDGPGIAPEHLGQVFKPLFSANRHRDGTGLGLSLVYRVVKEHGGTTRVQSTPGEGTTFTIELPIANRESSDDGSRADR